LAFFPVERVADSRLETFGSFFSKKTVFPSSPSVMQASIRKPIILPSSPFFSLPSTFSAENQYVHPFFLEDHPPFPPSIPPEQDGIRLFFFTASITFHRLFFPYLCYSFIARCMILKTPPAIFSCESGVALFPFPCSSFPLVQCSATYVSFSCA